MIRYQGQWVQEQIGPKTNYYGPPGVGNYQRQTPNAVSPKVLQPRGGQVMDGPGFNYPGSQRPAGPGAPSPRPGSGRIMDGPDSGFNYPGTGGRFPRPEPPPGMEYARSQEDSPQDAKRVFAGAEPRRNGGGQPPGGDMYAGGTPYFDERTGGGFPQPPAGGVQGWQQPGAAQPIQPQSQGTPYGQQGYDILVAQNEWDNFQRSQANASKGLPPKRSQMEIDREQQAAESQRIKDQRSLVQQSMPNADQATQQAIRQRMQWYGETPEQAYQNGGFASRQAQAAAANAPRPMPQNVDPGFNAMRNFMPRPF